MPNLLYNFSMACKNLIGEFLYWQVFDDYKTENPATLEATEENREWSKKEIDVACKKSKSEYFKGLYDKYKALAKRLEQEMLKLNYKSSTPCGHTPVERP